MRFRQYSGIPSPALKMSRRLSQQGDLLHPDSLNGCQSKLKSEKPGVTAGSRRSKT